MRITYLTLLTLALVSSAWAATGKRWSLARDRHVEFEELGRSLGGNPSQTNTATPSVTPSGSASAATSAQPSAAVTASQTATPSEAATRSVSAYITPTSASTVYVPLPSSAAGVPTVKMEMAVQGNCVADVQTLRAVMCAYQQNIAEISRVNVSDVTILNAKVISLETGRMVLSYSGPLNCAVDSLYSDVGTAPGTCSVSMDTEVAVPKNEGETVEEAYARANEVGQAIRNAAQNPSLPFQSTIQRFSELTGSDPVAVVQSVDIPEVTLTLVTEKQAASSSKLNGGAIAGILIGVLLAGCCYCCFLLAMCRRRRKREDEENERAAAAARKAEGVPGAKDVRVNVDPAHHLDGATASGVELSAASNTSAECTKNATQEVDGGDFGHGAALSYGAPKPEAVPEADEKKIYDEEPEFVKPVEVRAWH